MITGSDKILGLTEWMQIRIKFLIKYLDLLGYNVHIYHGRRTLPEQKHLLKIGHTTTLNSKHLTGEAFDLIITPEHGYRVAGEHWTTLGGKWGGHFKPPALAIAEKAHFQKL